MAPGRGANKSSASSEAIDETFHKLHALQGIGLSRMSSSIPGLKDCVYQEGADMPELQASTISFLRFQGTLQAQPSHNPALADKSDMSPSPFASLASGTDAPLLVDVCISRLPASLSLPSMVRKPYDSDIKVKLLFAAPTAGRIAATVQLHALDEHSLENICDWMPPGIPTNLCNASQSIDTKLHRMPRLLSIDDSPIHTVTTVTGPKMAPTDWQEVYTAKLEVAFSRVAFNDSSNMRPRWLAATVTTACGRVSMYTVFKTPTIVMSHPKQEERSSKALWGNGCPQPSLMTRSFSKTAEARLKQAKVTRPLTNEDYAGLEQLAMYTALGGQPRDRRGNKLAKSSISYGHLEAQTVAHFLDATIDLVIMLRDYFNRTNPHILCGFRVTRTVAERLLQGQLLGTFLLRFGAEAGTLVMSVRDDTATPGGIIHYRWRHYDLQDASVEQLVELTGKGVWLMDEREMVLHHREMVLRVGYAQTIDVMQAQSGVIKCENGDSTAVGESLAFYGAVPALPAGEGSVTVHDVRQGQVEATAAGLAAAVTAGMQIPGNAVAMPVPSPFQQQINPQIPISSWFGNADHAANHQLQQAAQQQHITQQLLMHQQQLQVQQQHPAQQQQQQQQLQVQQQQVQQLLPQTASITQAAYVPNVSFYTPAPTTEQQQVQMMLAASLPGSLVHCSLPMTMRFPVGITPTATIGSGVLPQMPANALPRIARPVATEPVHPLDQFALQFPVHPTEIMEDHTPSSVEHPLTTNDNNTVATATDTDILENENPLAMFRRHDSDPPRDGTGGLVRAGGDLLHAFY